MTQEPAEEEKKEQAQEEYKDKYLRLLAEVDNTRKRMQKERQEMTRFAIENALAELLGPIDNLENALSCAQNMSPEVRNWAMGFTMILEQFKDVLHHHGISSFSSEGELFDPHLHFAIESEENSEKKEGTILKEYMKGYKSRERTVRAARVKVAKKPHKEDQQQPPSESVPPEKE